jgi:hypothetical protein
MFDEIDKMLADGDTSGSEDKASQLEVSLGNVQTHAVHLALFYNTLTGQNMPPQFAHALTVDFMRIMFSRHGGIPNAI